MAGFAGDFDTRSAGELGSSAQYSDTTCAGSSWMPPASSEPLGASSGKTDRRPNGCRFITSSGVNNLQLDTVLDIVSRGADVLGRCPQDPASAPKTLNGWAGDGMCRATRDVYVSVNELGKNKWHKVGIGEQPSASALVNKQNIRMLTSNPATSGLNWVLGSVLETIALLRRRGLPLFHSPSRCLSLSR